MADDTSYLDDNTGGITTPLPNDDHPVDEPNDVPGNNLDDTHPSTDTNLQVEEEYDEKLSGAAEASEPNAKNAVADYKPQDRKAG